MDSNGRVHNITDGIVLRRRKLKVVVTVALKVATMFDDYDIREIKVDF